MRRSLGGLWFSPNTDTQALAGSTVESSTGILWGNFQNRATPALLIAANSKIPLLRQHVEAHVFFAPRLKGQNPDSDSENVA